jgi:hypothetical protein
MNKIERTIYDVKLFIKEKERQLLICQTERKSLIEQLKTLEDIQDDKSIPYETFKQEQHLLCPQFISDGKSSNATKCICGREKWEHPVKN